MSLNRRPMRLHRVPVTSGDWSGQLELVVDGSLHHGSECLGGDVSRREQLDSGAMECDQIVARHDGTGVVENSLVVGKKKRP